MARYRITYAHVPGHSAIDHVGVELAEYCSSETEGRTYCSASAAHVGGERALRRVLSQLRASALGQGVWRRSAPRIDIGAERA